MEILVLNTNFESVVVVDNFKSMIWTDRYNSYGDFEMYLSMNSDVLGYIKQDYYLWMKESGHYMIIESISIASDTEDGNHITVTGRSLESLLERRIVWGQKVLKGNLQDEIEILLSESIITPSIEERKIGNFMFKASTDAKITELTIDTQFTGDDLYSVVKSLCEENHIGFQIVLDDNNQFIFSLYSGIDRSYAQTNNPYVVFSPSFENILNSNYYTSKVNLKNVTFVAGEGEGASRKTAIVGSASGLNRLELFTDARDISSDTESGRLTETEYNAQLKARGVKNLTEYTAKTAFEGEVEATRLFKYGKDFFIGDIVQIANEYGHEGSAYISELVMSQSEEGVSMYPTFQIAKEKGEETE